MEFSLEGRTAVITGAARGNGAAIAEGLVKAGARVVLLDLIGDLVQEKAEELRKNGADAVGFAVDVSDAASVQAVADEVLKTVGDVDIVVNNAGIMPRQAFDSDEMPAAWEKTFAVNVNGPFNIVRAFLPSLKKTTGCIVNVASIQSFVGTPSSAAYAASKGAVAQFTRTLALELGSMGIRVNAIAPGLIDTPMASASLADPDRLKPFLAHVPLKRVGQPGDLAGPVVFLCSPAACYVTGTVLPVDGGYLTV